MSRVASTNVFEALAKPKASKDDEAGPAPPPRKGGLSAASSRLNVGDWADHSDDDGFHAAPSWADEVRGNGAEEEACCLPCDRACTGNARACGRRLAWELRFCLAWQSHAKIDRPPRVSIALAARTLSRNIAPRPRTRLSTTAPG